MSADQNCLFCKIVAGTIPAQKIFENEGAVVIADIHPQAPVHLLILPKIHVASLNDLDEAGRREILPLLFKTADDVAAREGFRAQGYRTVFNNQTQAGQTVFHLHLHVLAGAPLHGFGSG